jgi:hypothetical protein
MRDNIVFRNEEQPGDNDRTMRTDNLSIQDLRKSLENLQAQKDMLESQLARSPPKNLTLAEVKREKAVTTEQFELVTRNVDKLRLQLKQRTVS